MRATLFCFLVALLVFQSEASLNIPSSMLSPLGVPEGLGPAGMTAVKYAVGGRLLNMLGPGLSPFGGITSSPLGAITSGGFENSGITRLMSGGMLGGFPGYPGLTARSKEFSKRRGPNIPTSFNIRTATPTEIENFFGVLDRVDANKCITRLVCEIGADPKVLEGLGHNIKDVMSSLRVLEKNNLSKKYREIMMQGQKRGLNSCRMNYSTCDQKSYRLIRTFVKAFRVKQ